MQTLAQFVAYWNHRYCDFDHAYGQQCVDEADFYLRDVWGIPPFFVTGAVDLFGHRPDKILWITNDAGNAKQFPRPGDMVIWHLDATVGTGVNGHVDIWLRGNGINFVGFDENWPLNASPHEVFHNYQGVRGWGRLRVAAPPPAPKPIPVPVPVPVPVPPPVPPAPLPGPIPVPEPVPVPDPTPPGPPQPLPEPPGLTWWDWLLHLLRLR